jgi:hypothetical protein
VVDVANVMGARADGWWRDRAGAALRLCQEIAALADRGIDLADLPADVAADVADGSGGLTDGLAGGSAGLVRPAFTVVLEGRSRAAADRLEPGARRLLRVIEAPGSGDDSIVAAVVSVVSSGTPCLVVTADRELRRRCAAGGGKVVGPGWLLHLL